MIGGAAMALTFFAASVTPTGSRRPWLRLGPSYPPAVGTLELCPLEVKSARLLTTGNPGLGVRGLVTPAVDG